MRRFIKNIVWFFIDVAAFIVAICKVVDFRATNQAGKIRGYLEK